MQPVVLNDCRVNATCGQEAFLLKAFLVTFVTIKVTALAAIERSTTCIISHAKEIASFLAMTRGEERCGLKLSFR